MITLLLTLTLVAERPHVRATLEPAAQRQAAPKFTLEDASGKQATLEQYRGKVVLLDFWATWCGGCKEELPWFSEFQRKYAARGFEVLAVSLDDDGWKVVKPFLSKTLLPYRIVLGSAGLAERFHIGNMPDAFLIDRQGRIAATYVGLVDRNDIEANLQKLLGQ